MVMQSMIKVTATRAAAVLQLAASPDKEPRPVVLLNADGSVVMNTVKMTDLVDLLRRRFHGRFANRQDH